MGKTRGFGAAAFVLTIGICLGCGRENKETSKDARPAASGIVGELGSVNPTTRRALLVGVDEYETLPPLEYASSDVKKIRDALRKIGFLSENIKMFVSDGRIRERPSRERILAAFDKLLAETDSNSSIFIALSGHGFETQNGASAFRF